MKNLDCDHFPGVSLEPIDKNSLYHVPVLGRQVMAFLRPEPGSRRQIAQKNLLPEARHPILCAAPSVEN
jgi:hypothetical protein